MNPIIEVRDLTKRYGDTVAVDSLSFEVQGGEIFGLLGPNGAGKTTTIRIIMDIIIPDEGEVRILGLPPGEAKSQVGYLPEERGLYRNLKVLDTLVYLAELKGVSRSVARERGMSLLERIGLEDWAAGKVKDLSQGMQQRLQLIAALVHDPAVLFLDEPFQGLDPVNVERVKQFINDLRRAGKTIVLSSHQMNLVETLCDRILLLNRGRAVLYGPLAQIKRDYAPNLVRIRMSHVPDDLPGVTSVEQDGSVFNLRLEDGSDPQAILRRLLESGIAVQAFEISPVPLGDIFISAISKEVQR